MSKKLIVTVSALAVLILAQANNSLGASTTSIQSGRNRPIPAGTNVASVDVFYSYLAPYGRWFTLGNYGLVWSPAVVGPDWSPYANGRWVYTDKGWTWESDDPWGWATCHYGRWVLDATYGWVWIPGTIWGPAWVDWLRGRGYIGWAPLPPEATPATTEVNIPVSCYTFVEEPYFDNDDTPEQREPKHREHKHAGQYVHLPPSVGADLRRWGPDIPVWVNRPSSPSAAERPQKNKPVDGPSDQTRGQFSTAHPKTGGNGTPATPTAPSIHSGLERPNRPVPNESDGRSSRAKAEQQQPVETYRRQADDANHQQEAQQQAEKAARHEAQQKQAEEIQRRQAEEANRQQEAQRQQAEEARRQQEAQRQQAEEARRQQEAQQMQAEEARRQQEAQHRQAEEAQRQQEAQRRQAEEAQRQQEAQQKQAEESRRQQEAQQKQAEEAHRTKKP